MSADPNTTTTNDPNPTSTVEEKLASAPSAPGSDASMMHVWLGRIRALLLVTMCATFGVLLVILPWTPKWTDNPLLLGSPDLRDVISSGFVRGLASGLGLLNLWLGFWEAIHYHE